MDRSPIDKSKVRSRAWRTFERLPANFRRPIQMLATGILLAAGLAIWPCPTQAQNLATLDAIMDEAGSMREFLQNAAIQDRYYLASTAYYRGERFDRKSYDAILSQMKTLVANEPSFAARGWRASEEDRSTFSSDAPAFGRKLAVDAWDTFLFRWITELRESSSATADVSPPELRRRSAAFEAEIAAFERSLDGRSKKEAGVARGKFFADFIARPEIISILNRMILDMIDSPTISPLLRSSSADVILNVLENLKSDASRDWAHGASAGTRLQALARSRIFRLDHLLARTDLFPHEMEKTRAGWKEKGRSSKTTYELIAVRPFHSFFTGIRHSECVGGSCYSLEYLSARRWATAALEHATPYFLETEGRYNGNIRTYEIVGPRGAKATGIDLMASDLNKVIMIKDGLSLRRATVFELWLDHVTARRGNQSEGFAVVLNSSLGNERNPEVVKASSAYILGHDLGPAADWDFRDSYAHTLAEHAPKESGKNAYGTRLITEVSTPDAGNLTLLKPGQGELSDERLRKLLLSSARSQAKVAFERAARGLNVQDREHRRILFEIWRELGDSVRRGLEPFFNALLERLDQGEGEVKAEVRSFLATRPDHEFPEAKRAQIQRDLVFHELRPAPNADLAHFHLMESTLEGWTEVLQRGELPESLKPSVSTSFLRGIESPLPITTLKAILDFEVASINIDRQLMNEELSGRLDEVRNHLSERMREKGRLNLTGARAAEFLRMEFDRFGKTTADRDASLRLSKTLDWFYSQQAPTLGVNVGPAVAEVLKTILADSGPSHRDYAYRLLRQADLTWAERKAAAIAVLPGQDGASHFSYFFKRNPQLFDAEVRQIARDYALSISDGHRQGTETRTRLLSALAKVEPLAPDLGQLLVAQIFKRDFNRVLTDTLAFNDPAFQLALAERIQELDTANRKVIIGHLSLLPSLAPVLAKKLEGFDADGRVLPATPDTAGRPSRCEAIF